MEIFIQLSEHKVKDIDRLVGNIRSGLSEWKKESGFPHPINFTFMPMKWRIEIGI